MLEKSLSPTWWAISLLAAKEAAASAATVVVSKLSMSPCAVSRNPPLSMIKAEADSLFEIKSLRATSKAWMSSSRSWGRVNMSCGLSRALVDKFVEQYPGDHVQGVED